MILFYRPYTVLKNQNAFCPIIKFDQKVLISKRFNFSTTYHPIQTLHIYKGKFTFGSAKYKLIDVRDRNASLNINIYGAYFRKAGQCPVEPKKGTFVTEEGPSK